MKLSPTSAAMLAGLSLAACGGQEPATTAAPVPATTTATTPRPAVDPCALTTRGDATRALGTRAPAGALRGPTCTYDAGSREIAVTVTSGPKLPDPARSVGRGERRVSGRGYTGKARTFIPANVKTGTQSGVAIRAGNTVVQVLLTDQKKKTGSLMDRVVALGRAAARRLVAAQG